jgi:hypothetical protein
MRRSMMLEEGSGGGDDRLEDLCQPAITADPSEEIFNDPSSRQDDEADLTRTLGDAARGGDTFAGISAVGKDAFDKRKAAARVLQQRLA